MDHLITAINSGYILTTAILILLYFSGKANDRSWIVCNYLFAGIGIIWYIFISIQRPIPFSTTTRILIFVPYLSAQLFWLKKFRANKLLSFLILALLIIYHFAGDSIFNPGLPYPGNNILFITVPFFQFNFLLSVIYLIVVLVISGFFTKSSPST